MSMREYPYRVLGLYVKKEELNLSKIRAESFSEDMPDDEVFEELSYDCNYLTETGGSILPISQFTGGYDFLNGEIIGLLDDSINLDINDEWVLMELPEYPTLFKAAYKDEDDLILRVKELFKDYILNESSFDYRKRLIKLAGTYCG